MKLQVLVATVDNTDLSLYKKMNLDAPAIIANQCGQNGFDSDSNVTMLSTNTRGVGINRNLAISLSDADVLLFSDDDMTYYESDLSGVLKAFEQIPDADVIVFSLDYTKDGEIFEKRRCTQKRLRLFNSLRYGAARIAVRKSALLKHNITFSTLFGGGCIYGSGEDSIFLCNCHRAGLHVYSHPYVLGSCAKDGSSWFSGFDRKFLFDKGAFVAAAFPKIGHIIKWYFAYKFSKKANLSILGGVKLINKGMRAFKTLTPYSE